MKIGDLTVTEVKEFVRESVAQSIAAVVGDPDQGLRLRDGSRPFVGDDVSKTLARVIDRDPDWNALPKSLPPVLGTFLRGCLEKDARERVRDIGDVRLAMKGAFETTAGGSGEIASDRPTPIWQRLPVIAAMVLVTTIIVGGMRRRTR